VLVDHRLTADLQYVAPTRRGISSSGTAIVSVPLTASMGAPAATSPAAQIGAPVWPRGGTTSMPRLSL